jgi:hypothetical protein
VGNVAMFYGKLGIACDYDFLSIKFLQLSMQSIIILNVFVHGKSAGNAVTIEYRDSNRI